MGGDLMLTNYRVLFRPMDLGLAIRMLQGILHFVPGHHVGTVCKIALRYARQFNQQFGNLASWASAASLANVYLGQGAEGAQIPTLIIEYVGGQRIEVGVMKSMYTLRFSNSTEARDHMANSILAQLRAN